MARPASSRQVTNTSTLEKLIALLPSGLVPATDEFTLDRHQRDFTLPRTNEHRLLAVIYPRSTEEVAAVMRAANAAQVAVVPHGGLTGMAGGALPGPASIALSLEKMVGIEEVDTFSDTMTVLAGTQLQTVQEAAAKADRFFAVDMGSRGTCTIGGAVANNAGGNRVLRYGMMRDQVLGLEVVLADGTVISNLNKMIKNNAGYDLRHLFMGSEGTLGIVTRAVLRLFPAPRSCNTLLCAVEGIDNVHALLALARSALGAQLSAFEVMWQDFFRITHEVGGRSPLSPELGSHFVLLEALGSNEEADELIFASFAEQAFSAGIIRDAAVAQSLADAQGFWRIRDSSGELGKLWGRGQVVNFDVSVPVSKVEEFVGRCREALRQELQSDAVFFGHIADSNMHLAVPDPTGQLREAICRTVYTVVRSLSGSVSAEHGIGIDKRDYLSFTRSAAEIALMRQLKATLDPQGILNPGKVLPSDDA